MLCLWTSVAFGQPFPEKPAARLGTGSISKIAYTPDGELLTLDEDGIWLYDTDNLTGVALLVAQPDVHNFASSPDGKLLASTGYYDNSVVRLWDVESRQQVGLLEGHTDTVFHLAFSPDGKILASADYDDNGVVRLWDIETQQQVGALPGRIGNMPGVSSLAFSPDGKILASAENSDNAVRLWDVESQQQVGLLPRHIGSNSSLAFSPGGKILAWGGFDGIRLWDVESQQQISVLHRGRVASLAFSPDGKWLASGRDTILLWEVNLPSSPVSVESRGKQFITLGQLKRTTLLQNYPNPFNPETWIPFTLAESSDVEIAIYDLSGSRVRRLELGNRDAGVYHSKEKAGYWDGKNDAGKSVSSGVYFYELRAGEKQTFVRKAFLLK